MSKSRHSSRSLWDCRWRILPMKYSPSLRGGMLDNLEQIRQWSGRIKARSVDTKDMPFLNKTGMLDEERVLLGKWIALDDIDR